MNSSSKRLGDLEDRVAIRYCLVCGKAQNQTTALEKVHLQGEDGIRPIGYVAIRGLGRCAEHGGVPVGYGHPLAAEHLVADTQSCRQVEADLKDIQASLEVFIHIAITNLHKVAKCSLGLANLPREEGVVAEGGLDTTAGSTNCLGNADFCHLGEVEDEHATNMRRAGGRTFEGQTGPSLTAGAQEARRPSCRE
jgi:hypothetical protein